RRVEDNASVRARARRDLRSTGREQQAGFAFDRLLMHARCASAGSKHEPIVARPRGEELERGPERERSRVRRASQIEQPQVRVHSALPCVCRNERTLTIGRKRETGKPRGLVDTTELFTLAVEPRES